MKNLKLKWANDLRNMFFFMKNIRPLTKKKHTHPNQNYCGAATWKKALKRANDLEPGEHCNPSYSMHFKPMNLQSPLILITTHPNSHSSTLFYTTRRYSILLSLTNMSGNFGIVKCFVDLKIMS